MAERVVSDGSERGGAVAGDLGPEEGRAMLRAWLDSVDLGARAAGAGGRVAWLS